MSAHKHAAVIDAWARGELCQVKAGPSPKDWLDLRRPGHGPAIMWADDIEYRIKPGDVSMNKHMAYLDEQRSVAMEVESHLRTIGDLLQIIAKRHEDVGITFQADEHFKRLRSEFDIRADGRKFHGKFI